MSARNHTQTQHKQSRDTRQNEDMRTLRAANRKLARENSRLKKELGKRGQLEEVSQDEAEAEQEMPGEGMRCPKCGSLAVRHIEVAGRHYNVCPDCKWRKPVPAQ